MKRILLFALLFFVPILSSDETFYTDYQIMVAKWNHE